MSDRQRRGKDSAQGNAQSPSEASETTSPVYERRYKMLLSTIPSSVLIVDRDLQILEANKNFRQKGGQKNEEVVGRGLSEVLPPGIVENVNLKKQVSQVFSTGEGIQGQRMTYRAPGVPLRTYYYSLVPLVWEGQVREILLLIEDVTEQIRLSEEIRQVERHLASVVECARDIIVSTTPDGKIVSWNKAATLITGYKAEDVQGEFFANLLSPERGEAARRAFEDRESLGERRQPEWNLVCLDGKEIEVSWTFSLMQGEDSNPGGVVAIGRDLTERRQLESEILRSQKLAALGVMAGGIAHEIRNPLTVCRSGAEFLEEDDLSPEFVRECAEKIQTGVERASTIIENLLRFARPSGTQEMGPLELRTLIQDTVTVTANEAKLHQVELKKDLADSPVRVRGNENLLQQMLTNMIFNGVAAISDGGTLRVALEQDGTEALISVSDTGRGIPEEEIDNIFDPFYTTSSPGEGTGLGLSLCYSIIRQHNGSVDVDSTVGEGTTFLIRLPLYTE